MQGRRSAGNLRKYRRQGYRPEDLGNGLAYGLNILKRADFHKAEAEVVQVVVQFSGDIQAGAKADGIVELQAENFLFQTHGAVSVNKAAQEAPAGNHALELEISQGNGTGFSVIRDSFRYRSDEDTIHTDNKYNQIT